MAPFSWKEKPDEEVGCKRIQSVLYLYSWSMRTPHNQFSFSLLAAVTAQL